ncbi:DUF4105 domain-containing protein [bacterium]|nr:DUF4105 domain-containing protein [bacterium]
MTAGVLSWLERRPWSGVALVALAICVAAFMRTLVERPRSDRNWVEHLALMPAIDRDDAGFRLALATDWSYTPEGPADKRYTSFAAEFADLRNVWFVLEPHPGMKPMAHTLVLFEFADDRMIGLTIEARREANEAYSAVAGMFNAFELAFIWSTPRDLLTRRAVMLAHDVMVYPLRLDDGQKERFLIRLLDETAKLERTPRFYNTLGSNCTNELAKFALLDWHPSWVLTGYSAERLFALGLIPGQDFASAQRGARLTEEIRSWASLSAETFDARLLSELRRRAGGGVSAAAAMVPPAGD